MNTFSNISVPVVSIRSDGPGPRAVSRLSFAATVLCLLSGAFVAEAKLNVVATLPDYRAIAEAVGGDKVKVTSIARGTEDQHFVDARPSFVRVLNQADVLIEGGAELEIGWLPPLVNLSLIHIS